jgi:assimilatory nitrate reductase catalytic subunit
MSSPPRRQTITHCPYCALQCGLLLETEGTELVGQARWKKSPLTEGALCSKGSTAWQQVRHPERLRLPLVRTGGVLVETDWETALDRAADGFLRLRSEHGPDASSVLSGGSLTNEKCYLVGKFARLVLGTRYVDYNGRLCMSSAGAANRMAFGLDRAMTPLSELDRADVAVVIGANLSAAYPVVIPKALDRLRKRGGRVVVIDPRASRFMSDDDLHLALVPGTDAAVANGLLREIVVQGWVDEPFVERRTTGFAGAIAAAMAWTPEEVQRVAGVPASDLRAAAAWIGTADRAMYLHARGSEQQTSGTANVLALINVALARGHVGRPGCGIDMLTGQRNGQGGREWGQRCDQLPAGRSLTNPRHRSEVAAAWGVDPDALPEPGVSFVETLELAARGDIKGMLCISTNPAVSAPELGRAVEGLRRLEHLVVIDPFRSPTAELADVVLPGSTFAEEDGTITTIEGRVVRVDAAVAPIARRSDLDVLRNLARRLGAPQHLRHHTAREVYEEMRALSSGAPVDYTGIGWDRIRRDGGVFWPCPSDDHPGTPQLYQERFAHPDGLARFHAVEPAPPPVPTDDDHPLVLTTGRVLAQYLSRNQTDRIENQHRLAPEPVLEVHPDTAEAMGLEPDRPARLTSRQASVVVRWTPNPGLRLDTLFLPYHWEVANLLTAATPLDPVSRMPGLKHTAVNLGSATVDDLDLRGALGTV